MRRIKVIPILSILILFSLLPLSCKRQDGYVKTEGFIWNTLYHITYKGPSQLQDSIMPLLEQVGKSLSVFDDSSLVSLLNRNDSVLADTHLRKVYEASVVINKLSHGNFDPTVSPLVDAWGFGKNHTPTADTLAIDSILNFVGISKTHITGSHIVKDNPLIQFNFSAIAKGYGCDAIGDMFKRNEVTDFMVEIGGEIVLSGYSPSGGNWKIAIDAPVEDNNPGEESVTILSLTDASIATSGNYRNYRVDNGKKTAHTISPVTGYPVIGEILSATIIAPSCMEADAIATACMASSSENARALVKDTNVEALFVYEDSLWYSPGFSKFISASSVPGRKDRN